MTAKKYAKAKTRLIVLVIRFFWSFIRFKWLHKNRSDSNTSFFR